ncbi:MAG: hypothetical protein HYX67_16010 [Candidatus Melainabacteria bacterium]|nr:hypothetical protein [Candidatus Melainabacteria bacterium]
MTKNQLTVPEVSDERDELVQQVLDNPRELAPSVQVRFAKRVGRPGNSRVMMMDAQTSGPIGEEGEDSESKLALRLADGTNVQLSLSFFNENQPALAGAGGGGRRTNFAPFNTYVYEPRTYSIHERDSNRLPAIMVSMAFMLGAACYGVFFLTGQVHDQFALLPKKELSKPAVAAKPAPVKAAAKVLPVAHASAKAANEPVPVAPPITLSEIAPTKTNTKKSFAKAARSHEQMQVTHSSHSPRGEFFVPPPPPMTFDSPRTAKGFVPPPPPTPYMVSTGVPAAFDPLQALAPAVAHSNRVYTAPKKAVEPVSMTSTVETRTPVQQIAPSGVERPVVQQYGDAVQLQEQQPISAPIK